LKDDVQDKVDALRIPLALAKKQDFEAAIAYVASGRGRSLMEEVARRADEMKSAEGSLLRVRSENAEDQAAWNHQLVFFGVPAIALVMIGFLALLVSAVRRPLAAVLASMTAFGDGDLSARAAIDAGRREFDDLARAYNGMADRLAAALDGQRSSEDELQGANQALRAQGEALQARGDAIERLGGMAHRMQAARTDDELAEVISCFLPQVLETPGALYVHDDGRSHLVRLVGWGGVDDLPAGFTPSECWALRRGQSHHVEQRGADVCCHHVGETVETYHCQPVLAGGEVIGLLYLQGAVSAEARFRLTVLTENIASALVNHRLQKGLREQSIRDPLTNLFNRRYLEETLGIEAARARRGDRRLGVVMCDVDHFKRFNDSFGHDAGDVLLREVAALIQSHVRDGDVACRFGGEEFVLVGPGAETGQLARRAERLGDAIRALQVVHDGKPLGQVTMSFGIACLLPGERGTAGLLRRADNALYEAKRLGRDRVVTVGGEVGVA
jgi:diguanylate cyclase (GGDEF)-like protein